MVTLATFPSFSTLALHLGLPAILRYMAGAAAVVANGRRRLLGRSAAWRV